MRCAQDFVSNLTAIWQSVFVVTKPGISNMFDIHHGMGAVALQSGVVTAVISPTDTQFMDGQYRRVMKSGDSCIKSKWQSPCWHHNRSEWIRSQFGLCSRPMTWLWQDMTRRTWVLVGKCLGSQSHQCSVCQPEYVHPRLSSGCLRCTLKCPAEIPRSLKF